MTSDVVTRPVLQDHRSFRIRDCFLAARVFVSGNAGLLKGVTRRRRNTYLIEDALRLSRPRDPSPCEARTQTPFWVTANMQIG